MSWTVRPATPEDCDGIGAAHVAGWRAAYAGIMPPEFLAALSAEKRAAMWRSFFAEGKAAPGQTILVAEDGGAVVGFVNAGHDRGESAPDAGEIRAIYVLPSHWDRGVGRALHDLAVDALRAAGFRRAVLWVLDRNLRARRFYERQGWRPDGATKTETRFGGEPLVEMRYATLLGETRPRAAGSQATEVPCPESP